MDSFIENLKTKVQCSLCKHGLVEPTIVQCFHTFCKPCIKKHAQYKDDLSKNSVFECPSCHSETILPEFNEDENLKTSELHSRMLKVFELVEGEKQCSVSATHSPVLWHCFDCEKSFCDDCHDCHETFIKNHKVVALSDLKQEELEVMLRKEPPCDNHNEILESFCKECQVLTCFLCVKDDHKDHETMTLQEFKTNNKSSLSMNHKEIEILQSNDLEKEQQQKIAEKIIRSGEEAKKEVKKRTKELVKYLIDKEEQLLDEIQKSVSRAERNLCIIRNAPAIQQQIDNIIEHGNADDMVRCCHDNIGGCTKFTYSPFKESIAGIIFESDLDIKDSQLGSVRFAELSSHVLSEVRKSCFPTACEKTNLTLYLRKFSGEPNNDDVKEENIRCYFIILNL